MDVFSLISSLCLLIIQIQLVSTQRAAASERKKLRYEFNRDFKHFLNRKVGGLMWVTPFKSWGLPIYKNAHALDCSFDLKHKCCWYNTGGDLDEFEWTLVHTPVPPVVFPENFQAHSSPRAPFLATGSPRTFHSYQSMLISCLIACQRTDGILTISHWLTPGVKLDICRIEEGERRFMGRCYTLEGSRTSTIRIKKHHTGFYIAIVASGFSYINEKDIAANNGGIAIIDDIVYDGARMCQD